MGDEIMVRMPRPKTGQTPQRNLRVDDELWAEFGDAVGNDERSEVLREFIRWVVRKPGAKIPRRP